MTNKLEPRKKIRALRTIIYTADRRKINDELRTIQAEVASLEIQVEELKLANENLLMENVGVEEMRRALKGLCEYFEADYDRPPEYHAGAAALAAPDIEVPF